MQQIIVTPALNSNYSKSHKRVYYTTVGSKYQIVIPKAIRKELTIKPGDKLDINIDKEGTIYLTVLQKNWSDQNFGALKKIWKGINMIKEVEKIRNEPEL